MSGHHLFGAADLPTGASERAEGRSDDQPAFDPVWGTLGAPMERGPGGWSGQVEQPTYGVVADVELLGDGLRLSGKVDLGQFDRLSNWLNVQSGFIRLRDARQVDVGTAGRGGAVQPDGTLWVRISQIVVVADLADIQRVRSGVPIVQKQRRNVSILAHGFELSGNIHVLAHGDIARFLEMTDARFLPMTELMVRWLSGSQPKARFAAAMVNREQIVTLLEVAESAGSGLERQAAGSA